MDLQGDELASLDAGQTAVPVRWHSLSSSASPEGRMPPATCHSVGPITFPIVGRHFSRLRLRPKQLRAVQGASHSRSLPLPSCPRPVLAQWVQELVVPELCLPLGSPSRHPQSTSGSSPGPPEHLVVKRSHLQHSQCGFYLKQLSKERLSIQTACYIL